MFTNFKSMDGTSVSTRDFSGAEHLCDDMAVYTTYGYMVVVLDEPEAEIDPENFKENVREGRDGLYWFAPGSRLGWRPPASIRHQSQLRMNSIHRMTAFFRSQKWVARFNPHKFRNCDFINAYQPRMSFMELSPEDKDTRRHLPASGERLGMRTATTLPRNAKAVR